MHFRLRNKSLPFLLCLALLPTAAYCVQEESGASGPSYDVDLTDSINHYVSVTMTADATGAETVLMMPTWTPGSYLVREYSKHIDQISASDPEGNPLKIEKTSKNRWRVDTGDHPTFQVEYRIYCNERSVRTNWVGLEYAILNGAATFLTVPDQMDRPHTVQLQLPEPWTRSATSLLPFGDGTHEYRAANYDELVDSPIVAGKIQLYPFTVAGVPHQLVNINEDGYWDGMRAARDLAKIIEQHHRVWGVVPYDRYFFLNVIGGGGGGLEHNNCCLLMTSSWDFRDANRYRSWLSLASHEFFHAWNVRRLRPKSLVNYDYEAEVYTPSLWIAEGVTTYYQDLLVARAGLSDKREMISTISRLVSGVQRTEGRRVQSLRDSSFDAWIKYYRPEANSRETQISYYTKGALVAFLLDARIRGATGGEKSLDDAMRLMFERFADGGYLESDFRAVCSELAGEDLNNWFTKAVDSTDELEYDNAAQCFGLEINSRTGSAMSSAADPASRRGRSRFGSRGAPAAESDKPIPWIGIGTPDSPATRAGLTDADEILAINGRRVRDNIDERLKQFSVGDPIELLVSRDDQIREVLLSVGKLEPTPFWEVKIASDVKPEQTQRLNQWLGEAANEDAESN